MLNATRGGVAKNFKSPNPSLNLHNISQQNSGNYPNIPQNTIIHVFGTPSETPKPPHPCRRQMVEARCTIEVKVLAILDLRFVKSFLLGVGVGGGGIGDLRFWCFGV